MITKFNFKDRTIKSYAIRKLTPFECFRLMGVRDATIHIMQQTVKSVKTIVKKIFRRNEFSEFDEECDRIKAETGKMPKIYSDKAESIRVVALKRKDSNDIPYWEFFREDKWSEYANEQSFEDFYADYAKYEEDTIYLMDDFDWEAEAYEAEDDDEQCRSFRVYITPPLDYIKVEQKVGTEEMIISASQQYKQAGNSIVVDVLAAIYQTLIYPQPPKPKAQLSMFDTLFPEDALPPMPPKPYRDGDEFTVLTTFSGYDSQLMACDALREHHPNFRWTCAGWSDIDRYACQMHDLIFPQYADRALGDITKIDWHKVRETLAGREIDLFTYSPCQDISQAGKQMGLKEGSGSRSALLWNVADAVEILRPKYLLQENVAALVSEKFMPDFQLWLKKLESLGYVNRWALLNAKDYGVPQNRLRVFCLSMRKDCAFDYQFPEPMPLEKRLEDILEPEVDERYFLKDDAVSKFLKANDNDTALFHQFALPPTHEDAMFLKTWLQDFMQRSGSITTTQSGKVETINYRTAWELTPILLDEALSQHSSIFHRLHDQWKQTGDFPDEFFRARYEENMSS